MPCELFAELGNWKLDNGDVALMIAIAIGVISVVKQWWEAVQKRRGTDIQLSGEEQKLKSEEQKIKSEEERQKTRQATTVAKQWQQYAQERDLLHAQDQVRFEEEIDKLKNEYGRRIDYLEERDARCQRRVNRIIVWAIRHGLDPAEIEDEYPTPPPETKAKKDADQQPSRPTAGKQRNTQRDRPKHQQNVPESGSGPGNPHTESTSSDDAASNGTEVPPPGEDSEGG